MHISELWLYPLKGAAGIPVQDWPLDSFGLQHDRRWMVIDAEGSFVTQRTEPALGQLEQSIVGGSLIVRAPDAGELRLPLAPEIGASVQARVWRDDVATVDAGAEAAAFISSYLGRDARIVHMPEDTVRQVDPEHSRSGDRVSFVDGFPLLLIGAASLEELNRRLDEPVEMRRFRPNLVVTGAEPHGEDSWRTIRIGTVVCDVVKPCSRCVVTTVDPATGVAGREPLRTLGGYRRWNGEVWFGQNVIHRGMGALSPGDSVEVLDTCDPEPPLLM
jgi:hypothetical protein